MVTYYVLRNTFMRIYGLLNCYFSTNWHVFARLTTICYEHTNQSSLHLVFQSTNLVSSHSNQLLLVTKSEKVQLVWLQHQHNDQPSSTDPCILFDPQNSIFNTNKYISIHEKKTLNFFDSFRMQIWDGLSLWSTYQLFLFSSSSDFWWIFSNLGPFWYFGT